MKFLVAAFTSALMIFALATSISQMMSSSETTPSVSLSQRRAASSSFEARRRRGGQANEPEPISVRSASRIDTASGNGSPTDPVVELAQQKISEIRQREADLQSQQDSLRMIVDEIRNEQAAVTNLRQRVTEEIATLTNVADELALTSRPSEWESLPPPPNVTTSPRGTGARKPAVAMSSQAAQDTAILVRRLVEQNSLRSAANLLSKLRERDAAKVLAALSETDPQIAFVLTETLQANRSERTALQR